MDSKESMLLADTGVLEEPQLHALTKGSTLLGVRREREAEEKVRG